MIDAGVNVGLGVDGACSSDAQSLLAEARLALLLQRAGGDPRGLGVRWKRGRGAGGHHEGHEGVDLQ